MARVYGKPRVCVFFQVIACVACRAHLVSRRERFVLICAMVKSSAWIALDAPEWSHDDLARLRDALPGINDSASARWACIHSEPMPRYRLWVEPTDMGVAFGFRPRDGMDATTCPALDFVRAAIRYTVDELRQKKSQVCVFVDKSSVHLPCGTRPSGAFLEELWRQTGADVPGEEAEYACACGGSHAIRLSE